MPGRRVVGADAPNAMEKVLLAAQANLR
jgi:hypothetical protein